MNSPIPSRYFFIAVLVISLVLFSLILFYYFNYPRIAYVYNSRVLSEYQGLKEIKVSYDKKVQNWQANLDTLSKELNDDIRAFEVSAPLLSSKERFVQEQILKKKELDLYNYKASIEKKAKEEEIQIAGAALNQINNFILEFGKESGYDYIFGVTENGNLLYAKEGDDITNEIINEINGKYSGSK